MEEIEECLTEKMSYIDFADLLFGLGIGIEAVGDVNFFVGQWSAEVQIDGEDCLLCGNDYEIFADMPSDEDYKNLQAKYYVTMTEKNNYKSSYIDGWGAYWTEKIKNSEKRVELSKYVLQKGMHLLFAERYRKMRESEIQKQ